MNPLTISQISAAVDAAFQTALAQAAPVTKSAPQAIGYNATLRTDVYMGPKGSGFVVYAAVDLKFRTLVIVRQHGPETWRECPAPELAQLVAECQQARAKRYEVEASVYDLADAETKLGSSDPAIQAEGVAQKTAALAKRLQIKVELPKPQ